MKRFEHRTYASCARTLLLAGSCLTGSCPFAGCGGGSANTETQTPRTQVTEPEVGAPRVTSAVHGHGDNQASARMGSLGGELTLANGAHLVIPPGALAEDIEVMFALGETVNAFNNRDDERIVGPSLVVAPELRSANGAKFVVELPYTTLPEGFTQEDVVIAFERNDEDATGFRGGAVRTTWDHAPARALPGNKLRAEFTELPGLRVQFVVSH